MNTPQNARLPEEAKKDSLSIFIDIDGPFAECSGDEYFEREFHGKRDLPTLKQRPLKMLLLLISQAKKNYKEVEIITISSWSKMEVVSEFIPAMKALCPSDLKFKYLINDIHFKPEGGSSARQKTVRDHMVNKPTGSYLILDDGDYYNDPYHIRVSGWDGLTFADVVLAIKLLDFDIGEVTYFKKFYEVMTRPHIRHIAVNQDPHFELLDIEKGDTSNYTIECIIDGHIVWNVLINDNTVELNKAIKSLWDNPEDCDSARLLISKYRQETKCH